jgi:hypothetical protein
MVIGSKAISSGFALTLLCYRALTMTIWGVQSSQGDATPTARLKTGAVKL